MSLTKDEYGLISTIAEGVRHIRETELPEIKADVREARDSSRSAIQEINQINYRVSSLEDSSPIPVPLHSCNQVQAITEIKTSLDKSKEIQKYLIPIGVTIVIALSTFITASIRTESTIRTTVDQHEKKITDIQTQQRKQSEDVSDVIKQLSHTSERLDNISNNLNSKTYDINVLFEERIKNLPSRERDKLREVWSIHGNYRN